MRGEIQLLIGKIFFNYSSVIFRMSILTFFWGGGSIRRNLGSDPIVHYTISYRHEQLWWSWGPSSDSTDSWRVLPLGLIKDPRGGGRTRPWGPSRKRAPKCLKVPTATNATLAIAEKQFKRSKKGPFFIHRVPPGNRIDGARGKVPPGPPPPPVSPAISNRQEDTVRWKGSEGSKQTKHITRKLTPW